MLFVMHSEQRFRIKHIHLFAKDYFTFMVPKATFLCGFQYKVKSYVGSFKMFI